MSRQHLTAALVFLLVALVLTNPLALHVWNAVEDKQDALLNTWIVAWVGHALITSPLSLFDANIFYPYANTLAFSEILLPSSLLALPLRFATDNPIFAYNSALLGMLWLDAFGMYLLARALTRRASAAMAAGMIFAFNPFNLGNLAQLQLLALGWLPLALLALHRLLAQGARRRWTLAVLFSLFFSLESLSSFYYALLSALAVALYVLGWLVSSRRALGGRLRAVLAPLLLAIALSALLVTPFLLPYFTVQRELGFERRVEESEPFSASLVQFLQVAPENVLYGRVLAPSPVVRIGGYPLDTLFPGLIALGLAVIGLVAGRRVPLRRYWVLLLGVAFVLALGPRLYLLPQRATDLNLPYRWLYDLVPAVSALRAPVRFDALINLALAGLAGAGAAFLVQRVPERRVALSAAVVIVLIGAEYLSVPAARTVVLPVSGEIPTVYRWLESQPPGVALELPMMGPNAQGELDISTQYYTTYHWHPTPDGYSGFVPTRRGEIAYEFREPGLTPRGLALLEALDVHYLIVPGDWPVSGSLAALAPLQTAEGKTVYAVPAAASEKPNLAKSLYLPSALAASAPFDAYLILINHADRPYAVKPTARAALQAYWSDGRTELTTLAIPLLTSSVSVVPVRLTAPARPGRYELRLQAVDPLIGKLDAGAFTTVGNELASLVVLPARVRLGAPLPPRVGRGESVPVVVEWQALNKINAYYSASVRLVDASGVKVSNVDRQPSTPTLLWTPDTIVADSPYVLAIPTDLAAGRYQLQLMMYQADSGVDALLLDAQFEPHLSILLGEVEVE